MDTHRLTAHQPESAALQLSPTQTSFRHLTGTQGFTRMPVRSAVLQVFSLRLQPTELQETIPLTGSPSPVRFIWPHQHSLIPLEVSSLLHKLSTFLGKNLTVNIWILVLVAARIRPENGE